MYNSATETKIQDIPQIRDIDLNNLPRELTKIYAHIVTFRRQLSNGEINFSSSEFNSNIKFLETLAYNLETYIIKFPESEKSESIAFVAGTAHHLIHSINEYNKEYIFGELLNTNQVSFQLSAILLFLIGNSQADAAEAAAKIKIPEELSPIKQKITNYIIALAKGKLADIINNPILAEDIDNSNIEETAIDLIWRELAFGISDLAKKLTATKVNLSDNTSHFDTVIELSISSSIFEQKTTYSGPFHLAKLLKPLEVELLKRGVINIPAPLNISKVEWDEFLTNLAKDRPYLWENHMEAVNTSFLNDGTSAILTLPTGAGKSTLSELKIASCLFSKKHVIYLVPTHALEDQVNKNLKSLFKDINSSNVYMDSEYSELMDDSSFPILVMTPERCLTAVNMNSDFLENIGLVVFDEFHLIHGTDLTKDKRSLDAMYCLLTLFLNIPHADYLLISAMVENGKELSKWVSSITNSECILFDSAWKPTRQLHGCLTYQNKEILALQEKIKRTRNQKQTKNPSSQLRKELHAKPYCLFSLKRIWESVDEQDYYIGNILDSNVLLSINNYWSLTSNRNKVAANLASHFIKQGLKTLVFVSTPTYAMSTAREINSVVEDRKNCFDRFLKEHQAEIESLKLELGELDYSYFDKGQHVGVHHGLLIPLERYLIEEYFKAKEGSMAMVATATLAQGINLPAEIVIIAGDDRYNSETNKTERIPPHELLNAAGRAGRAGQSSQGAVILIPGEVTTIDETTISKRWWELKKEIFSKSDQCLIIEDPIEFFLDAIQEDSLPLNINQTNALFRYRSEENEEQETKKLLNNSLYAFKTKNSDKEETFNNQVIGLLKRRSEMDKLSNDVEWTKEISYKTGLDPDIILELGNSIDQEDLDIFSHFSIKEIVDWYFNWIQKDPNRLKKIFTKNSTIIHICKAIGLNYEKDTLKSILEKFETLKTILNAYIEGQTLKEIEYLIPKKTKNENVKLDNARNFVIRLIPDLSFSFGLLPMIMIQKAKENNIVKSTIPITIRNLASCIREGVDEYGKLSFKLKNDLLSRVETHEKYKKWGA
ncbi:DEAD/DEAH box helicase [Cellulophaga baltica]|uniref:DEAD/DEAH box helicase n=1 Tax=Cellulophaga baltica TaxID=76594 RepID=UPI002495A569|nr:DEAD/DEAH box helicase [Cellulophaga baltica]